MNLHLPLLLGGGATSTVFHEKCIQVLCFFFVAHVLLGFFRISPTPLHEQKKQVKNRHVKLHSSLA